MASSEKRNPPEHTRPHAGDSAAPLLHLGFVGESDKPMETPVPGRGNKWPPSPTLGDDEGLSKPSDDDDGGSKHSDDFGDGSKPSDDDGDGSNPSDDGEWLVSGSEEEDEDHDDQGTHQPYTVVDIPRPGCDHKKQSDVMFRDPDVELRGPLPIRLFPAFKDGNH